MSVFRFLALAIFAGCTADVAPRDATPVAPPAPGPLDAGSKPDAIAVPDAGEESTRADPFATQVDTSEGLTNVSADLEALLEHGALPGACAAYEADPNDRRKRLLCGKAMFFYEGFGTIGVPAPLFDFMAENFDAELGVAFERYGLVRDPYSMRSRPVGFVAGGPLDTVETVAFGCASCHFGQLADGRYAAGAPNLDYEYGKHTLALMLAPLSIRPGFDAGAHHPDALAAVSGVTTRLSSDRRLRLRMLRALLPLLQSGATDATGLSREQEGLYARWLPGTMDFMMAPLPLDDDVHTVTKIIALWGIPTPEERDAANMPSGLLAWTGAAPSLMQFLDGFVRVGGGDPAEWPAERLAPLAEYVHSLRAPAGPAPTPGLAAEGSAVFRNQGCIDCHDGPRGSGREVYRLDEIGTDEALARWGDADLDGNPCCGIDAAPTHGVKSPRLTGLWTIGRLLHNGSVPSLEALLCLGVARGTLTEVPYSDGGHDYGCDLSEGDKRALIAYLKAH